MRRLTLRLLPLLTLLLVVAACARPAASPTFAPPPTPGPTAAATPTAAPTAPGITLVDDEGTTIELPGIPETIVSLTPATTELLFGLGVGERLRGRTDLDLYPAEATALPVVATYQGVRIEDVVAIGPDLVIAGGNNFTAAGDVTRLRDLGIPVLVVYAPDLDGVLADVRLVGQAVGEEEAAEGVVGAIQTRIDEVTAAVAGLDRPRTFYEIGYEPEIYGPAPDSFVADMVNLAGGEPITTTDPAVFAIPLERLVTLDPEVIVLGDAAYGTCPHSVATRAGWAGMTAVRDGQVRPADDIIITLPGPRLGEGLAALALAIHPDADIEPPTAGSEYCSEL
ncbi:MAG TPA: helical backbone metal receptor [Candidatus Limnocylindrales bacterium]